MNDKKESRAPTNMRIRDMNPVKNRMKPNTNKIVALTMLLL